MLKKTLIAILFMPLAGVAANEARRWTPAAIATAGYESSPTFTPDGRTMLFLSADADFSKYRIMQSRCEDGRWGPPQPPSFTRPPPVIEADPFVTQDGRRLYYISSRQDPKHEAFDIWFVERVADGAWSKPQRLPEPVNSAGSELLPRLDAQGRLYFGSDRVGGHGQGDIYVALLDAGGRWQVSNVGPPVNTAAFEYEAEVSRDGQTMIVVAQRTDRSHLFHYRRQGDGWIEVGEIPARAEQFQVGPLLSPRVDRLLFAQRDGERSGEIFLLDLAPAVDESWPPQCQ